MDDAERRIANLTPAQRAVLARRLHERATAAPDAAQPPSFAQERFWLLEQIEPRNPAHVLAVTTTIRGPLEVDRLVVALRGVVARHEALRTSLSFEGGVLRQVVEASVDVDLQTVTLAGSEDERVRRRRQLVDEMIARGFDLAKAPLLRFLLLRSDPQRHELVCVAHHAVIDGLSLRITFDEMWDAYASRGDTIAHPPAMTARALAVAERAHAAGGGFAAALSWWKARLDGLQPLDLVKLSIRAKPTAPEGSATRSERISRVTPARLREAAKAARASPFTVVYAVLQHWIHGHVGVADVAIGTPVSGRLADGTSRTVGALLNVVVLRATVDPSLRFSEHLACSASIVRDAFDHQELPFELLIEALSPERAVDRHPLVQVMLNYVDFAPPSRSVDGLVVEARRIPAGSAFDLVFEITAREEGLELAVEASRAFCREDLDRFLRRFDAMLERALADCDVRLSDLPSTDEAEAAELARFSRPTPCGVASGEFLPLRLARALRESPDRVAVEFDGAKIDHATLDRRADALTAALLAHSVARGESVGVLLEPCPDLVAAFLAIHRAHAAWVPLDPQWPEERLAHVLRDSAITVVITTAGRAGQESLTSRRPIVIGPGERLSAPDRPLPALSHAASDAAYLIYTSGSTGRPKAVVVTHGSVRAFFDAMAEVSGCPRGGRWLATTNPTFDIAVLDLLGPLLGGGTVVIASREDARDGTRLRRRIEQDRIDVMQATPSTWRSLLLAGWSGDRSLTALCGGEALQKDLARELVVRSRSSWNLYGPTEATIWSTIHRVTESDLRPDAPAVVSIGRPLAGTTVRVMDEAGRRAPIGVPGELWIGGPQVAAGYRGLAELTSRKFTVDRTAAEGDRVRFFRTGDRVAWRSDGSLDFFGRMDRQVKLRGHRIEPAEIEASLRAHPQVADAVAGLLAGEDPRLLAWVVSRDGDDSAVREDEILRWLTASLPPVMVPGRIVFMASIPLTSSGKVDVARLPPPPAAGAFATEAPIGELESTLAGWWKSVLPKDAVVARDADFFRLGGHSLGATRIKYLARERFGVDLPMRSFFAAPTVGALARLIEGLRDRTPTPRAADGSGGDLAIVPLTAAQRRLVFLDRLHPGSTTYGVQSVVRVRGVLDTSILHGAWDALVVRHDALRLRVEARDGEFAARIDASESCSWREAAIDPTQLDHEIAAEASRPFDLQSGPLLRVVCLRIAADDHVVVVTQHHLVTDGTSIGVLARELAALTAAMRAKQVPNLPPAPSFASFARHAMGADDADPAPWVGELAGAPLQLDLPLDRRRPAFQTDRGREIRVALGAVVAARLQEVAAELGATPFALGLAAFAVVMGRAAGVDDLVLGTSVSSRRPGDDDDLVGFCVDTLPLRLRPAPDRSFRDLVSEAMRVLAFAIDHRNVPFDRIVRAIEPPRDLTRTPIFQVAFEAWAAPLGALTIEGCEVCVLSPGRVPARFDLTVFVADDAAGTSTWVFNADLFDDDTIHAWQARWVHFIEAALAAPDRAVEDACHVGADEQRRLVGFSRGEEAPVSSETILDVIGRVCASRASAVAISSSQGDVTFDELWRRSGALARRLGEAGVCRGDRVLVDLPRSVECVIAVLAAMRAGAAFVPLDPSYPQERRSRIANASGPRAVIGSDPATCAEFALGAFAGVHGVGEPITDLGAPLPAVAPDDAAYVMFTSGSTGRPKGVVVGHRGLLRYVENASRLYGGADGVGAPLVTSLGFDLTITSLFVPLVCGRTVFVVDGEGIEPLIVSMRRHRDLSFVKLTPSHLDALAAIRGIEDCRHWTRVLVVGGEALPHASAISWMDATGARVFNEYGPTEAVVGCLAHEVSRGDCAPDGTVPIGRPMRGVSAWVLDDDRHLAPMGVAGELWIGGAGLSEGYLHAQPSEADRFVPDPFTTARDARLYRTGDVCRWRRDGSLLFLGRRDEQVKLRGHRIELGEVEAAIRDATGASGCAVAVARPPNGEAQLVAWVTRGDGLDAAAIQDRLRRLLPPVALPRRVVHVDTLPLTAHGKVDRARIERETSMDLAGGVVGDGVEPRTPREAQLARIVGAVLGRARVGVTDDLFAIGADSISSLRIVSRARAEGIALGTRDVFEHPTVAGLARLSLAAREETPSPKIRDVRPGENVPLTPIQRWFFAQGFAEPNQWNQVVGLEVPFDSRSGRWRDALGRLVQRHPQLRARFRRRGGEVTQSFVDRDAPAWSDLGSLQGGVESVVGVVQTAVDAAHASLDVENGPLLHAIWFRAVDLRMCGLVCIAHHLVVDGVSWRLLLDELVTDVRGESPDIRALDAGGPATHAEHARRLAERAEPSTAVAPASRVLDLPRAIPVRIDVPADVASVLRGAGRAASHASIEEVILAAVVHALASADPTSTVSVDVEHHGREGTGLDLSHVVGWLTDVHRISVTGVSSASAALRAVKSALRAARGAGRGLASTGVLAGAPARILFNDLGEVAPPAGDVKELSLVGLDLGRVARGPTNRPTHPLEVNVWRTARELRLDCGVSDPSSMVAFREHVLASLRELAEVAATRPKDCLVPADFTLARLTEDELRVVCERAPDLTDVLPLTSTQQGMYFHALLEPESRAYFQQLASVLEGPLDAGAFRASFEHVASLHEMLRASVIADGLAEPRLLIRRTPDVPWVELDWRGEAHWESRLDAFLEEDRRRGFVLDGAPLLRCALIRSSEVRHVLVFTWHHLILDGWSMPILLRDVVRTYDGRRLARAPRPTPMRRVRDYIAWLGRQDSARAHDFWRSRFDGFEPPPRLPAGAPADASRGVVERTMRLDRDATRSLERLAQEVRATPASVVLAAWARVLAAWTGCRDVLFGATVSGRSPEVEGFDERVGLFINTRLVRVRIDADEPAGSWIRAVHDEQVEAGPFDWTPMSDVQRAAGMPLGRAPFDSLVVIENYPIDRAAGTTPEGISVLRTIAREQTSYPVTFVAVPGEAWELRVQFDPARVDGRIGDGVLEQVEEVLRAFAADPARRVGSIGVLTGDGLSRWRALADGGPALPGENLVTAVMRRCSRAPDATIVEDRGSRTSGRAFLARVDEITRLIEVASPEPGPVAVTLGRSADFAAAMLAVWQVGRVAVPLDPSWPLARQQVLLARLAPALILAPRASRGAIGGEFRVAYLDAPPGASVVRAVPRATDGLTEPACIYFTSGTTGEPKGVELTHAGLASYVATARASFALEGGDRVLQFASTGFDASAEEIWCTLVAGATLVIRDDGWPLDPCEFWIRVAAERITVLDLPTSYWHELVRALPLGDCSVPDSVRLVILGGEAASPQAVRAWRDVVGSRVRLVNTYGPTEGTIVATLSDLTAGPHVPDDAIPIGRPLPGVRAWVLDDVGSPAPVGAVGELYLGGRGVARGYWNDPAATATSFVADTFIGEPGARAYETGDRVRWRPDGQLEWLGRIDDQVKIRGHRVEPREVEALLRTDPSIADAVVVAVASAEREVSLRACCIVREGVPATPDGIRGRLSAQLPAASVPAEVLVLDAFPITVTGKIDRRALARAPSALSRSTHDDGSLSEVERTVARAFSRALGCALPARHESFFSLGGHSLAALRVVAALREATGSRVLLRQLFDHPTVSGLASLLERGVTGTPVAPTPGVDLRAAVVLPDDVVAAPPRTDAGPRLMFPFVTGATGFLGAFVLRELLEATTARVACLVRAASQADGLARLHAAFARFALDCSGLEERVDVVVGRLDEPRFGLDERHHERLSTDCDAIIHAGGSTSFAAPYAVLAPTNVGGTIEVLRFASRVRAKPLHHVSSIGVFDCPSRRGTRVDEGATLSDAVDVTGSYAQSKWVAEELVRAAGMRGLPVTIHRVGRLTGSSRTGACNREDFVNRLFAACVELGCTPEVPADVDLTPVDFVAKAIVRIAGEGSGSSGPWHLMNPATVSTNAIVAELAAMGVVLRAVPLDVWRRRLRERAAADEASDLHSVLAVLEEADGGDATADAPVVTCPRTTAELSRLGIRCPPPDASLLATYWRFFERSADLRRGGR